MKKSFLALLLGGGMAVGVLSVQMPVAAQAITMDECNYHTDKHIKSYAVTPGDGQLTVTIDLEGFEADDAYLYLKVFDMQLEKEEQPWGALDYLIYKYEGQTLKIGKSDSYTFTGLTGGKTYYVYAQVIDRHECEPWEDSGEHYAAYLEYTASPVGPSHTPSASEPVDSTSSVSSSETVEVSYEETLNDQIKTAQPGSTIVMEKGVNTLTNATMKELLVKSDVSLKLEFTYNDKEYVIIIPAGKALDNDIPYYGPLYLAQQFGNCAGTEVSKASGTYKAKSGDSLSKIAAANNMTLKQLLEKNPQIKDPNKIYVGQEINR